MLDQKLYDERKSICEKCPLYKIDKVHGPICDSNKYISPDGTKWSWFRKDGYVRGCGCHMTSK
jgi:hypothetical protein